MDAANHTKRKSKKQANRHYLRISMSAYLRVECCCLILWERREAQHPAFEQHDINRGMDLCPLRLRSSVALALVGGLVGRREGGREEKKARFCKCLKEDMNVG